MKKLRVLLVDADPDRLEQISSMLAEADHSVLPVNSLEEAEEALFVLKIDVALFASPHPEAAIKPLIIKLREIERTQKNALRATVLAISPDLAISQGWYRGSAGLIDGYLPEGFGPEMLVMACDAITQSVTTVGTTGESAVEVDLPIFEPEKFRQQVAYDPELTIEIIGLFFEEKDAEIPEMQNALENGYFQKLSQVAHTIKGSLSSLHAMRARHHAQELETAAKRQDGGLCRRLLKLLESDLDALEPLLLKVRDEVKR